MPLADMFVPLGAFAMFGYIVFVVVDSFRRRQQLRMVGEFHSKLLDRVGSASELVEFFGTEGGARFLESLNTDRSPAGAHERILRATQAGIVLLALGVGLSAFLETGGGRFERDTAVGLMMFAVIVFSLGIGLVASAAVSWRLSKRLGLLPKPSADAPEAPPLA